MIALPRVFVVSGPWRQGAWERESRHLTDVGIPHEMFVGLDNDTCHVDHTSDPFVTKEGQSLHPDGKTVYCMGHKALCGCIRTLMVFKALQYCPEDSFWVMDDDSEFIPDWRVHYESAMAVLPNDWDVVILGHCCCVGRPTTLVGNNLYDIRYPLSTHAFMVHKKALPTLHRVHMRMWAPMDIAMFHESFPLLRVYTILPRIAGQRGIPLPP